MILDNIDNLGKVDLILLIYFLNLNTFDGEFSIRLVDLCDRTGCSISNVSMSLRHLHLLDFIKKIKGGKERVYKINSELYD